jgi:hypothetical protein
MSNPLEDLATLINKLQSSIIAWENENLQSHLQSFFTDCRYHRGSSDHDNSNTCRSNDSYYTRRSDHSSYAYKPNYNNNVLNACKLRANC